MEGAGDERSEEQVERGGRRAERGAGERGGWRAEGTQGVQPP